jgi:hypothetical protein
MTPAGWFAAGMCAVLAGQWLGMLLLAYQRQRFYNEFRNRKQKK